MCVYNFRHSTYSTNWEISSEMKSEFKMFNEPSAAFNVAYRYRAGAEWDKLRFFFYNIYIYIFSRNLIKEIVFMYNLFDISFDSRLLLPQDITIGSTQSL